MTTQINSVIDDIKNAFNVIIDFHDPFRGKNRKPKVLDMTYSYYWTENKDKFSITKTNNINGYASDKKYNIIIYEPPKNSSFDTSIEAHLRVFPKLLYDGGIIVVKVGDFHTNGRLKGHHEVHTLLTCLNYDLIDTIVCKHKLHYSDFTDKYVNFQHSKIIHTNFMIFKKFI